MTQPVDGQGVVIEGRRIGLPVRIRDATGALAAFVVPAGPVRDLLAGTGLAPVTLAGRTLACVFAVAYRDGDLDAYDEFGLAFPVRGPDGRIAGYMHQLPVSAAFTRAAGIALWGFPKWLADIEFAMDARAARCRVLHAGAMVAEAAFSAWKLPPWPRLALRLRTWTFGGRLRLCPAEVTLEGVRARPGGATLRPGEGHPLARELRALGFPRRAVFSAFVRRARADILAAQDPDKGERNERG